MKPAPFEFARADSLDEALRLLGEDGAHAYAGGQSLGPMLNLRLARPRLLVDLSRIPELREVGEDRDGLTVGASTVHADFEDGVVPDVAGGLLRRAASGIAYRAVRNRGTVGGSLAHADPAADWPPVLMALDAGIRVLGSGGERVVEAGDFVTGPLSTALERGEIVRSVRVPRLAPGAGWGHCKVCVKPGDFAESLAVAVVSESSRRVALAGPSAAPLRLRGVEDLLAEGDPRTDAFAGRVREAAARELLEAGFADEDDGYALDIHGTAVSRAVREAFER